MDILLREYLPILIFLAIAVALGLDETPGVDVAIAHAGAVLLDRECPRAGVPRPDPGHRVGAPPSHLGIGPLQQDRDRSCRARSDASSRARVAERALARVRATTSVWVTADASAATVSS